MSILSEFAERLQELMQLKNIKSEQLGKDLNISGSIVRYWLRGQKQTSLPNLLKLADYFGCTMDFLADRSDKEIYFTPQTPPPPFPQALRNALKARGMSRYSLNRDTKFTDSYIYSWDHGSPPDLFSLYELADLLDCTIDFLVGREK